MVMDVARDRYTGRQVVPFRWRDQAKQIVVNLPPLVYYPAGTILGLVTGAANDVQTLTITGTPTAGSVTLGVYPGMIGGPAGAAGGGAATVVVPYNSTAAALKAQLAALFGAGNVDVTGGAWPGTALVVTFQGMLANSPVQVMDIQANGLNAGATVAVAHTTTGRSAGTYKAYADANNDGSGTARCILQYDCTTDGSGLIVHGQGTPGQGWGPLVFSDKMTPAWAHGGTFRTEELTGLDAAAVADLGRLLSGTVSSGELALN